MAIHTFGNTTPRIGKFKGRTLKKAMVMEVLGRSGRQVVMPRNNSDTYVARRWIPYGGTSGNPNQFYQNGTGDRTQGAINAHLTVEGVTPTPETITPVDTSVVMQQLSCLYGWTDKVALLYEDDIPKEMSDQTGQRVAYINEQYIFGALKAGTNAFYGGTGNSISTVNGGLTLGMLRKIAKGLDANHAMKVTKALAPKLEFASTYVEGGYDVYASTDLAPDIRDLPGFKEAISYGGGRQNEFGKCESFRFFLTPEFPSRQDAGATVASTPGFASQTGTNIDVYSFIVLGEDAYSQVAIRGAASIDVTYIPTGTKTGSDPFGQRGYAGAIWWKGVLLENNGWLAVGHVGAKTLV